MSYALWENQVPFLKNEEDAPTLTPYLVDTTEKTSAVIVFPGGGYQMKADHEGEPIARWLNSVGISAFVLDYRVSPYTYPVPLMDAQRAIRYVRYHAKAWKIREDAIGILGFSAGGHLASLAGTHFQNPVGKALDSIDEVSCRPDFMILCYPVISFSSPYCHEGSVTNLAGDAPSPQLIEKLSTHLQVTEQTPPTYLWHTSDDEAVPVENSLFFASALSQKKVPFDLHVYEHGYHGLGLAPEDPHVANWTGQCQSWLKNRGLI